MFNLRKKLANFSEKDACAYLLSHLKELLPSDKISAWRFMEVCGSHTVAIFRTGLTSLLPENILHLSGPGCPVCVTSDAEIATILEIAKQPQVILATFADLLRIPVLTSFENSQNNSNHKPKELKLDSLQNLKAKGKINLRLIYSPLEALELAKNNRQNLIVLPAIGFETTAPTTAAVLELALEQKIDNFAILPMQRLINPALQSLLSDHKHQIKALLLPGHVAAVTGMNYFQFLISDYQIPSVIAGFEAVDILLALCTLAKQSQTHSPQLENAYPRVVTQSGNAKAMALVYKFFQASSASWRGLGQIPESKLELKEEWQDFHAIKRLNCQSLEVKEAHYKELYNECKQVCHCGEILRGLEIPPDCPLFAKVCNPQSPYGPCMVSSEGSCAAYFKYHTKN